MVHGRGPDLICPAGTALPILPQLWLATWGDPPSGGPLSFPSRGCTRREGAEVRALNVKWLPGHPRNAAWGIRQGRSLAPLLHGAPPSHGHPHPAAPGGPRAPAWGKPAGRAHKRQGLQRRRLVPEGITRPAALPFHRGHLCPAECECIDISLRMRARSPEPAVLEGRDLELRALHHSGPPAGTRTGD